MGLARTVHTHSKAVSKERDNVEGEGETTQLLAKLHELAIALPFPSIHCGPWVARRTWFCSRLCLQQRKRHSRLIRHEVQKHHNKQTRVKKNKNTHNVFYLYIYHLLIWTLVERLISRWALSTSQWQLQHFSLHLCSRRMWLWMNNWSFTQHVLNSHQSGYSAVILTCLTKYLLRQTLSQARKHWSYLWWCGCCQEQEQKEPYIFSVLQQLNGRKKKKKEKTGGWGSNP